jgi:hypothetical protein
MNGRHPCGSGSEILSPLSLLFTDASKTPAPSSVSGRRIGAGGSIWVGAEVIPTHYWQGIEEILFFSYLLPLAFAAEIVL